MGRLERPDRPRTRAYEGRVPSRRHGVRGPQSAGPRRRTGSDTRVVYTGLFTPGPDTAGLSKPQLVTWLLGSHEYLLQCIEGWAAQIVVRYGLDEMFDIQWKIWGETVLPAAKQLKAEYLGITGNTVADWMKDLQVDATAMPGKAFDVSFEMPEPDVGIMTFNRCVAADQWETMGRPDILEKNCHSTCPKSMIVTTKMYNPNMKVDILAIPPRKDRAMCAASGASACGRERPRVRPRDADHEARSLIWLKGCNPPTALSGGETGPFSNANQVEGGTHRSRAVRRLFSSLPPCSGNTGSCEEQGLRAQRLGVRALGVTPKGPSG